MHKPETDKQTQQQPETAKPKTDKAAPPPVERPRGDAQTPPPRQRRDG